MEKELAKEFIVILRQYNIRSIGFYKLFTELEAEVLRYFKEYAYTKGDLATLLRLNRTTVHQKMKRLGVEF